MTHSGCMEISVDEYPLYFHLRSCPSDRHVPCLAIPQSSCLNKQGITPVNQMSKIDKHLTFSLLSTLTSMLFMFNFVCWATQLNVLPASDIICCAQCVTRTLYWGNSTNWKGQKRRNKKNETARERDIKRQNVANPNSVGGPIYNTYSFSGHFQPGKRLIKSSILCIDIHLKVYI